jgi:replicative DNA helicase
MPPHNIEAEQALLGAILVNNDAFDRVSDFLKPSISPRSCTGASTRSPRS